MELDSIYVTEAALNTASQLLSSLERAALSAEEMFNIISEMEKCSSNKNLLAALSSFKEELRSHIDEVTKYTSATVVKINKRAEYVSEFSRRGYTIEEGD